MKKRMVALLMCLAMATVVTGCSNKEDNTTPQGTEAVVNTEDSNENNSESVSNVSIEYEAKDYVKLGEYKGLAVTLTQDYEVDENDLKDYVNNTMIANNPYLVEVDHDTVQTGDFANIDYKGTKDGEAFAGGTAEGYDLEIGSGTFIDGFEDGVLGMKVGEEKDLNLTFPESYSNSDLAGQKVVFHVKLNKIQTKQEVTYDTFSDEYATYYAQNNNMTYTSADTLLTDVMSYLQGTSANQKASAISEQVLPMLLENCTIDKYPEGLLDAEIAESEDMYVKGYGAMYGTLEDIGKSVYNLSLEEFKAQIAKEAEENLKIEMILDTIADEEAIEVDEEIFQSYVQRLMENNDFETEDALYLNYADDAETGKEELKKEYRRIQALSFVVNNAAVTVQESTETTTEAE